MNKNFVGNYIVLISLLLFSTKAPCQDNSVTIYLKDSNEKNLGSWGNFQKDHFRFKKEKKSKKIKIPFDSISRIIFTSKNGDSRAYEQHKISGIEKPIFFEVLLDGHVSLYKPHPSFGGYGGFLTPIAHKLYFKRNEDSELTFLFDTSKGTIFVNHRKMILQHFGDCKRLVEEIEIGALKADWTYAIVNFYNRNCF